MASVVVKRAADWVVLIGLYLADLLILTTNKVDFTRLKYDPLFKISLDFAIENQVNVIIGECHAIL